MSTGKLIAIFVAIFLINYNLSAACVQGFEKASTDVQVNDIVRKKESILLASAKQGNLKIVTALLGQGVPVNCEDSNGNTPIMLAANSNEPEVVKCLLEHGANLSELLDLNKLERLGFEKKHEYLGVSNVINDFIKTGPGEIAVKKIDIVFGIIQEDLEKLTKLLDEFPDCVNCKFFKKKIPLLSFAINTKNPKIVQIILDKGANPDLQGPNGSTALMLALNNGYMRIVQILLDRDFNVNLKDIMGYTLLMISGHKGYSEIASMLLDRGADIDLQDADGDTALMHAIFSEKIKVVRILLDKNANIYLRNKNGYTAIISAAISGSKEIAQLVLDKIILGMSTDSKMQKRDFIEFIASSSGLLKEYSGSLSFFKSIPQDSTKIIKNMEFLLNNIIKNLVKEIEDQDVFIKAIKAEKLEDIESFIKKDPDVVNRQEQRRGTTPLMFACEIGNKEIVELLIHNNADIFAQTKSGWTAQRIAQKNNFPEIVALLQEKIDLLDNVAINAQAALLLQEQLAKAAVDVLSSSCFGGAGGGGVSDLYPDFAGTAEEGKEELAEQELETFRRLIELEQKRHDAFKAQNKSKVLPSGQSKQTNLSRLKVDYHVSRWEDKDYASVDAILKKEYSDVPETIYDDIISRHKVPKIIKTFANKYFVYLQDKPNHETCMALCYIIDGDKKMQKKVIEYGINNTEVDNQILVHQFINLPKKYPDIEKLFISLPDDIEFSDPSKSGLLSNPEEDGSYVIRKKNEFIEIYDPEYNRNIIILKAK